MGTHRPVARRAPGRLEPAPVVVDGRGPVATESAAQLRRCGVVVRAGWHAGDAAELALAVGGPPPALVVLASDTALGTWSGAPWQARGIPHLPVAAAARRLTVGPLVLPGRSACVRCVLRARAATPEPAAEAPGLAAVVLAAAVVTVTALAVLRGDESLAGISTEIGPGATAVTHRFWPPRPDCPCASVRMAG